MIERVARHRQTEVCRTLAAEVFADGDEFHLGSNNSLTCVMQLGYAASRARAQRGAAQRWKIFQPALLFLARLVRSCKSQVAVIDRFQLAALILFDIFAVNDPLTTEFLQTLPNIGTNLRIAVWTTGVINAYRGVSLEVVR